MKADVNRKTDTVIKEKAGQEKDRQDKKKRFEPAPFEAFVSGARMAVRQGYLFSGCHGRVLHTVSFLFVPENRPEPAEKELSLSAASGQTQLEGYRSAFDQIGNSLDVLQGLFGGLLTGGDFLQRRTDSFLKLRILEAHGALGVCERIHQHADGFAVRFEGELVQGARGHAFDNRAGLQQVGEDLSALVLGEVVKPLPGSFFLLGGRVFID